MGSLRNPIGPLPSSIYWRRRAVAATLVVLLALLIVWAVTSGGGKADTDDSRPGGSGPARSITPGPSQSGPAISEQPGGRDESGESGSDGGDNSGTGAGSDGGASDSGIGGSGPDTGADGATVSGATAGEQVPAGSSLPDCAAGALQLSLSTELSYSPGEKPKFQLAAKNTSSTTCKADFGPKSTVLTITEAGGDDSQVWSSKDCPRNAGSLLLKVPAGSTVVHTVEWDRKKSTPQCATRPAGTAGPGTYLVEAKAPGEPVQRASFVLAKD
ncbi:hypothetical protein ABT115_12475 [Streptomyces sp. NPDC001832]|uniref:hypothetical protein n=1 Tax=Streptomyces sp. NPDC001832 TaxID=3154527 RepID=UPI003317BFFF